ncbi:glycosyltransferase family protein [Paenibacillus chungangensis]|uniref:Glycosyltransferase n=1 Tax=Paenibacillus chungangensis TaxID=696535 RepID=A0ABW3HLG0_9BACL
MEKYDIFHFHFGETFFPDKRDLSVLKKAGKKMIVHHNGSDARMLSVARSYSNPYVVVKDTWPESRVHENLKQLSAYIDHAIINDYELLPYIQPYYKKIHVLPYAIDVLQVQPFYPTPHSLPLVVHAPSHREIKGTAFIVAAVQRLWNEGVKFQFQLLENMPRSQVMEMYTQSTIIIDQLRIGTYANLSMEAMAMGKPVICYIRDDLRSTFPPDLPIVSANPNSIYNVLKDLLHRPGDWRKRGIDGRKYVERNHSYKHVGEKLIQIYHQL